MISSEIYQSERKLLWALCYRMTADAAEADDLVQETFVRAMEKPPRSTDEPWRPWLVSVALNLSRDRLRARKRRQYRGPWLPSPVPTDDPEFPAAYELPVTEISPATRYDLIESVSFAFLLALEALTPSQRAVLLLRDVFDYSTEETAEALKLSESNVKVTLHRARKLMVEYDKDRIKPSTAKTEAVRTALGRFLACLGNHDVAGLERLLAADVVNVSDGGGEVFAALTPIRGRDRVMKFFLSLAAQLTEPPVVEIRTVNGLPAVVTTVKQSNAKYPSRSIMSCELDPDGRIVRLHTVVAPSKLRGGRWIGEGGQWRNANGKESFEPRTLNPEP